jgi:hypothetical protein
MGLFRKGSSKFILTFILVFFPTISQSANLEEYTKVSNVAAMVCKNYAEDLNVDAEKFSKMYIIILRFSEKMGYVNDAKAYMSEIDYLKSILQDELLKEYGSKMNIYNKWCSRVYSGFQKSFEAGNK